MLNLSQLPRKLFKTTFCKKAHVERGFIQAPLLTVDEFQESLLNGQVDTNTLLLFKDGKVLNSQYLSRATTSKISGRPNDRFWCMNKLIPLVKEDLLSLKVYNFSNFRKDLKKVDNQLKAYFHTEVTSNVYFTPSNSQCFEPHSDPYNILIFQTSGQKHWKVWEDEDSPTKFNEINFLRFNRRLLKTGKVLFQSFDMFNDSWSGLDHIFLSNIIHDYSEDKVRSLFKNMKDKKSVFLLEILREENELSACYASSSLEYCLERSVALISRSGLSLYLAKALLKTSMHPFMPRSELTFKPIVNI